MAKCGSGKKAKKDKHAEAGKGAEGEKK